MISSIPSVPIRGQRNKKEGSIGYFSRPHKLSLHFRPPLSHHQVTPTPSPLNSPQGVTDSQQPQETTMHTLVRVIALKRVFFQLSVLLPLAGALLLFVGLIQLVPGAEAKSYGTPLIVIGTSLLIIGLLIIIIRFICKWQLERFEANFGVHGGVLPEIKVNEPSLNDVDLEKAGELESLQASHYSQQQSPRRGSQQQSGYNDHPATTSSNNRSNTAGLEQVQVDTSGGRKSSSGGGTRNGTAPSPNYYYNPLNNCNPQP